MIRNARYSSSAPKRVRVVVSDRRKGALNDVAIAEVKGIALGPVLEVGSVEDADMDRVLLEDILLEHELRERSAVWTGDKLDGRDLRVDESARRFRNNSDLARPRISEELIHVAGDGHAVDQDLHGVVRQTNVSGLRCDLEALPRTDLSRSHRDRLNKPGHRTMPQRHARSESNGLAKECSLVNLGAHGLQVDERTLMSARGAMTQPANGAISVACDVPE